VLVKVSAASVNPLDVMVRNGEFKRLLKYRTPFVLGHDLAGVVTRVGSAVRDFQVGDGVYARPRGLRIGTFAQYIAIDQDDVAAKPASLTPHEAAAVPLVSLAAWQALVDRAHLKPGQKVLVHAGSGGLGSTVIQLAKHLGATVATTARGENAELVRSLGADVVIDYTKEDFAEVLSGYDVVLDSLGGENLARSLTVLKPGGQAIGVTGPPDPGFAKQLGAPKFIGGVMGLLSPKLRKQARKLGGTCAWTAPVAATHATCEAHRPARLAAAFRRMGELRERRSRALESSISSVATASGTHADTRLYGAVARAPNSLQATARSAARVRPPGGLLMRGPEDRGPAPTGSRRPPAGDRRVPRRRR
jgi:NADPH:quinone reductase-like Zn-dependent oxidoreductase